MQKFFYILCMVLAGCSSSPKLQGVVTEKYPNGKVKGVYAYNHGKLDGSLVEYYYRGQNSSTVFGDAKFETTVTNGKFNSPARFEFEFNTNVKLRDKNPDYGEKYVIEFAYKDGLMDGDYVLKRGKSEILRTHYTAGKINGEYIVRNGDLETFRANFVNGKVQGKISGLRKEFENNFKVPNFKTPPKNIFLFVENLEDSYRNKWFAYEGYYVNGKMAESKIYYPNGKLYAEKEVNELGEVKVGRVYYPNGKLQLELTPVDHKKSKSIAYYKTGKVKGEAECPSGNLAAYTPDGKLLYDTSYNYEPTCRAEGNIIRSVIKIAHYLEDKDVYIDFTRSCYVSDSWLPLVPYEHEAFYEYKDMRKRK